MTEVVLFHHAQGLTPGVLAFADELRRAGHTVHTPDVYDGRTFDSLDTRKLIGQAQGILMERLDIDADRAFEYLVRQSQARNEKLRTIAEWIVTNRGAMSLSDLDL